MANTGMYKYTVQESNSMLVNQLVNTVKVQPTFTLDDNDDNHVAFNWTEIPNVVRAKGQSTLLQSIVSVNGYDADTKLELIFCSGNDDGTAPTAAQRLGVGSALVDLSFAEAKEINVQGKYLMGAPSEGDFLAFKMVANTLLNMGMTTTENSTSLYVAGVWRDDPADMTSHAAGVNGMDFYFTFQG